MNYDHNNIAEHYYNGVAYGYDINEISPEIFISDIVDNAPYAQIPEVKRVLCGFKDACINNDVDLVKRALKYMPISSMIYDGLKLAIKHQSEEVVNIILTHGEINDIYTTCNIITQNILEAAIASLGSKTVMRIYNIYNQIIPGMLSRYVINNFMIIACQHNDTNTVRFFIGMGANDYNRGLLSTNNLDIAKLMIDHGARNCNNLSAELAFSLFNDDYEIEHPSIQSLKKDRIDTKHKIIRISIDNLHIPMYDINITGIICDYVAYGLD